jgi:hypothetical protein
MATQSLTIRSYKHQTFDTKHDHNDGNNRSSSQAADCNLNTHKAETNEALSAERMSLSQPLEKAKRLMRYPESCDSILSSSLQAVAAGLSSRLPFSSLQALPSHTQCMFYKTQRCENNLK